jgi:hypothetical protein
MQVVINLGYWLDFSTDESHRPYKSQKILLTRI